MPAHKLPNNQAAINRAEYGKRWCEANRQRVRDLERARRIANPQAFKEKKDRYCAKNKEKIAEYAKARWQAKGDEIKARLKETGKNAEHNAKYRAKYYEKCLQMTQSWKDENPERRKETNAKWSRENATKLRTYKHNRRARKKAIGGSLSSGLAKKLFALQRGLCACCREPLGDSYEMDHIHPLALGGTNTDNNIQLLTRRCNRQKGRKPAVEFMQSRGNLL